jgi:hypothetical protein
MLTCRYGGGASSTPTQLTMIEALINDIFTYLRENDTTGLTCAIKLADTDAKVCIQLTQMEA